MFGLSSRGAPSGFEVTRLGASLEHPWLDFKKYIAARRLHEKKTIQISLDDVKRQIMVLGIEGA
eukprot:739509-Amphidinium_carterae.1